MKYKDRRVRTQLENKKPFELDEKLQELLIATKFRDWKYERELRVFVKLNEMIMEEQLHFYQFGTNLKLVAAILGANCNNSLECVRQLTRTHHPDAVVFKARLGFKFYKVVPDERTLPPR